MKKLVIGILAHVDAGKTTLSEGLLYLTGKIKKLGRVDHKDAYLDTHDLERARGITIFSKQAFISTDSLAISLLDTPGHVDFSAETERTLQVLDYAILVISGTDGVQSHTETLWRLLRSYHIPTFIFINKMDLPGKGSDQLMADVKKHLSTGCVDFSNTPEDTRLEEIAVCDDDLLEHYLENGTVPAERMTDLVAEEKLFPCFFGSALKLEGVSEFIDGLSAYTREKKYSDIFAAKVYKISRDPQGNRLTFLKVTGGALKVRMPIAYSVSGGEAEKDEKINQIRVYSGAKFDTVEEAKAGEVCAVTGLTGTYPGQGLGAEAASGLPILEPVLTYRIHLPSGSDIRASLAKLRLLEEEDPQLHIVWNEHLKEIHAQLMGEVQTEILKSLVKERFDMDIGVDSGRIMYKETITAPVEGVGHFEPLRHYAEVHLILEPLERGSGLVFTTSCSEDSLDRNWQRLILTHLEEKQHLGVLTGSPITDMKITLAAGRAHLKHTEGGDFRQATYRAVRQGLMTAESILLEPYYDFRLEVPTEQIGRAINDIRNMNGTFSSPEPLDDMSVIFGNAPVSTMREYTKEVIAYTRGKGKFSCSVSGYAPCHDPQEVISQIQYNPEGDLENTPDSVFCAHGAGYNVKWRDVPEYMHLDSVLNTREETPAAPRPFFRRTDIDEKELEAIMEREFGPIRRPVYSPSSSSSKENAYVSVASAKKEYFIADGYNIIFAWDELKKLAQDDLDTARKRLMDILSNFTGYKKCEFVLVFDAYKVAGNPGKKFDYNKLHVVFTKEGETGDMYIEKLANDIGKNYSVRVVTSDSLIQLSALRSGVLRMSAMEFYNEVQWVDQQIKEIIDDLDRKKFTQK